jgi:hypothetical protein
VLDDTPIPAADETTPPASTSRFTARSLQDLLALLRAFQQQSDPPQSAPSGIAKPAGTED